MKEKTGGGDGVSVVYTLMPLDAIATISRRNALQMHIMYNSEVKVQSIKSTDSFVYIEYECVFARGKLKIVAAKTHILQYTIHNAHECFDRAVGSCVCVFLVICIHSGEMNQRRASVLSHHTNNTKCTLDLKNYIIVVLHKQGRM